MDSSTTHHDLVNTHELKMETSQAMTLTLNFDATRLCVVFVVCVVCVVCVLCADASSKIGRWASLSAKSLSGIIYSPPTTSNKKQACGAQSFF